jgi:hypothetical protein
MIEKFSNDPSRISTKGYGYTKPIASNETAEEVQNNRHLDAVIECIKQTGMCNDATRDALKRLLS